MHEHLDLLAAALKCPSLFSIPDVTPLNFCKKCHVALSMVKNGGMVKTGRTLLEWEECGSECKTCGILTKRKQVRGRQKKVSNVSFIFRGMFFIAPVLRRKRHSFPGMPKKSAF